MNSKYFDDRMIMLKENISKSICMEASGLGSDTAAPIDINKANKGDTLGNKTLAPVKYNDPNSSTPPSFDVWDAANKESASKELYAKYEMVNIAKYGKASKSVPQPKQVSDELKNSVFKNTAKAALNKPETQIKETKGIMDTIKSYLMTVAKSGYKKGKDFAKKIIAFIKKIWSKLMEGFTKFLPGTGIKLSMVGFMILALVVILVGASGAANAIKKTVSSFMTAMKDIFANLMSGIAEVGKAAISFDLTKFGQAVIAMVMNVVATPFAIIGSMFQAIADSGNAALLGFGTLIISLGIGFEIAIWHKSKGDSSTETRERKPGEGVAADGSPSGKPNEIPVDENMQPATSPYDGGPSTEGA